MSFQNVWLQYITSQYQFHEKNITRNLTYEVTWFHSGDGEMVQVSQKVIRVSHSSLVHKAGHVQAGGDTQEQRQR